VQNCHCYYWFCKIATKHVCLSYLCHCTFFPFFLFIFSLFYFPFFIFLF
jgi:hypothetical protein